jgi:hypothetical protein
MPRGVRANTPVWICRPALSGIHGPPERFAKTKQFEAFAVALDQIERLGGDPTNLLVEVTWGSDGIAYEVAEFPSGAG